FWGAIRTSFPLCWHHPAECQLRSAENISDRLQRIFPSRNPRNQKLSVQTLERYEFRPSRQQNRRVPRVAPCATSRLRIPARSPNRVWLLDSPDKAAVVSRRKSSQRPA